MSIELLHAELITDKDTDFSVADAARVSMAKSAANFDDVDNIKLMRFLHKMVHWSPYGHARLCLNLTITDDEWLHFLENANLAGFTWQRGLYPWGVSVSGSLWAWYENGGHFPIHLQSVILLRIHDEFPIAFGILFPTQLASIHVLNNLSDTAKNYAVKMDLPAEGVSLANCNVYYAKLRIAAPILVARQLVKHQVHLCWNEESRRYIDEPVKFYEGDLRKRGESIKQGSLDELIDKNQTYKEIVHAHHQQCDNLYRALLEADCAPEQARGVLPLNSITNWVWTGSLRAWARVCKQRCDPHAQLETRHIGNQIDEQLGARYPGVWSALRTGL